MPGLGTFEAFYQSASFDSTYGVFYPAKVRVSFSGSKVEDPETLISSIARRLKIKNKEAEILVEEFVDNIKTNLKRRQYYKLEGLGYLMFDSSKNLSFKDTFWKRTQISQLNIKRV